jgi:ACS family hexuronate transporter-like MFS transporter
LLFVATALSFLDRQVLSVLAPAITREFHVNSQVYSRVVFCFQASYTVMFTLGGKLADLLGTRVAMACFLAVWSLASGAHALARGAWGLGSARFLLGLGEGGCFPAASKGAAEWFPPEQRALAMGIATGGSALGALIAPPLTAFAAAHVGWRGTFAISGLLGLIWLFAWLLVLGRQASFRVGERAASVPLARWLHDRRVLSVLLARFLFDPVFYFYMFWIPQYLARERGMSVEQIGSRLWIPFLVLGISQVVGGRVSDLLVKRGWEPVKARGFVLAVAACLTPALWLAAVTASPDGAIALMCVLMFAHGFWITNFLGLLSDLFPPGAIGTITGLTGTAGGVGGMISTLMIGAVVDRFSFFPVFVVSGILYPLALGALFLAIRQERSRYAALV